MVAIAFLYSTRTSASRRCVFCSPRMAASSCARVFSSRSPPILTTLPTPDTLIACPFCAFATWPGAGGEVADLGVRADCAPGSEDTAPASSVRRSSRYVRTLFMASRYAHNFLNLARSRRCRLTHSRFDWALRSAVLEGLTVEACGATSGGGL